MYSTCSLEKRENEESSGARVSRNRVSTSSICTIEFPDAMREIGLFASVLMA